MSGVAHCPECQKPIRCGRKRFVSCSCGTHLMATAASHATEIPVRCDDCGDSFLARPKDAGREVKCKCGEAVLVPSILLSKPLVDLREDTDGKSDHQGSVVSIEMDSPPKSVSAGPKTATVRSEGNAKSKNSGALWLLLALVPVIIGLVMFFTRGRNANKDLKVAASAAVATAPPILPSPAERTSTRNSLLALRQRSVELWTQQSLTETAERIVKTDASLSRGEAPAVVEQPFGQPTSARRVVLPPPRRPRERIATIPPSKAGSSYRTTFDTALQKYDAYNKSLANSETSKKDPISPEQQAKLLGEALGWIRHARQLAISQRKFEQIHDLHYLLAYLNFQAGNLIEASIFGEAAARWGDIKNDVTLEAAMISLAAAEEASGIQWGDPASPGELARLAAIAQLIQKRWPKEPKLPEIQWTLATRYEMFGLNDLARQSYQNVSGERRLQAKLRAARTLWYQFQNQASVEAPNAKQLTRLLKQIDNTLSKAVTEITKQGNRPLSEQQIHDVQEAKYILARVALRTRRYADVEAALTDEPFALIQSTSDGVPRSRFYEPALLTQFESRLKRGDWFGASQSVRDWNQATENVDPGDVANLDWRCIRTMIQSLDQAKVITSEQLGQAQELMSAVDLDHAIVTTSRLTWLAQSFQEIAAKTTSANHVSNQESSWIKNLPSELFARIIERSDVSERTRQSIELKLVRQLEQTGDWARALAKLTEILDETPNAISLQLDAALLRERVALESTDHSGLAAAAQGDGSVWGWAKLLRTANAASVQSESETDRTRQRKRMLMAVCHYHFCQLIQAVSAEPSAENATHFRAAKRQLSQILATTPADGHAERLKIIEQLKAICSQDGLI